jgi:hypothetical protein
MDSTQSAKYNETNNSENLPSGPGKGGAMSTLNNLIAIADIQKRCSELAESTGKRHSAEIIQLPLWPLEKRGTPNSFLRSALFAAIQGKDRVYLEEVVLASQKDISVKFTGKQLNQEDLTVWETLVHLARSHPLGNECSFSAHGILKAMELPKGGEQHKQLHSSIIRLTACAVQIKHEGRSYFGSLIEGGVKDEVSSHYHVRLNRDLLWLFDDDKWTAITWRQRLKLRRKPLAQALHAYYSSHRTPHPVKLTTLRELSGSRNRQAADFKRKCAAALDSLTEIGFLQGYEIKGEMVVVSRSMAALAKSP